MARRCDATRDPTGPMTPARTTGPARHERPAIDEAGLAAGHATERALEAARQVGADRWVRYLAPLPDRLRDGPLPELRAAAFRVRAAYGAKDSIRDALPWEVTEPLLVSVDRVLKLLARRDAEPD